MTEGCKPTKTPLLISECEQSQLSKKKNRILLKYLESGLLQLRRYFNEMILYYSPNQVLTHAARASGGRARRARVDG